MPSSLIENLGVTALDLRLKVAGTESDVFIFGKSQTVLLRQKARGWITSLTGNLHLGQLLVAQKLNQYI